MPTSNAERIAEIQKELEALKQELDAAMVVVSSVESALREYMLLVTKVSVTQTEHYTKLVELIEDMGHRLSEFERWRREISTPRLKVPKSVNKADNQANNFTLATRALRQHFNDAELRGLVGELGISMENIEGATHNERCHELVGYMQRRGRFWQLVKLGREKRPHALWPADTGPLT